LYYKKHKHKHRKYKHKYKTKQNKKKTNKQTNKKKIYLDRYGHYDDVRVAACQSMLRVSNSKETILSILEKAEIEKSPTVRYQFIRSMAK